MSASPCWSTPSGAPARTSAWVGRSATPSSSCPRPASRRSTIPPAGNSTRPSSVNWPAAAGWTNTRSPHQRGHRRRQDLPRLCAGESGLPERLPGPLPAGLPPLPRLALARADGTYVRLLGQLARVDVLVLDDWALTPLQDPERRDILEILEDRSATRRPSSPASCHRPVARVRGRSDLGGRDLRSPSPQCPPDCATRTLTEKGGEARQLAADAQRRSAPITIPDRRVHHGAIGCSRWPECARRPLDVICRPR